MDPVNPDWLYAATWQRHLDVAAYMGGGPGTAIYRSRDGRDTWEKLSAGLPESDMGKIGLAISPQQPDVLYAAIELERRSGAVYRSADRGASWIKLSATVSGATGPHYYQELYASPHQFDRIYLVDVRIQVSEDGGKTFRVMKEENKHSDNHAIAFREDDPDYLLVGTDGGLYESFDLAENWRFIANLPVTQFYKVALDDSEPFYYIYGGTQDNSTQGGPSRTDTYFGIRNADWFLTLFADGHQPATEPGNPDIMNSEWQEGNLVQVDRTTGEIVYIKPQPEPGGEHERFNWDAPILVSPHSVTRIYYGSQRVWRSDNRGDSWKPISGDLTRNQEDNKLKKSGEPVAFPGWQQVEAERRQQEPGIWITIRDQHGEVVRKLTGPVKKGFHRVAWDLRYPSSDAILLEQPASGEEEGMIQGWMVAPGEYTAMLSKEMDGVITPLSDPVSFQVKRLEQGALKGSTPAETVAFWRKIDALNRSLTATSMALNKTFEKINAMQKALPQTKNNPGDIEYRIYEIKQKLFDLDQTLNGNRSKEEIGEKDRPNVKDRMNYLVYGTSFSTYGPNTALRESLEIARNELIQIKDQLQGIRDEEIPAISEILSEMDAPWIEGQEIPPPDR